MSVAIRAARSEELPELSKLLEQSDLPVAGVSEHLPNYLVAEEGNRLVGMVGLEIYDSVGLLRSLAVRTDQQGKGIGVRLVQAVLAEARSSELDAVYLLTTTAERYFPRFGFQPIARDEVDPRLSRSEELQGACPQTAICMRLRLD